MQMMMACSGPKNKGKRKGQKKAKQSNEEQRTA
jgi:hypothetical protein